MSDKFINQVYWDSGAQAYYTGSQISSSPKQRIHFANRLMEPSASIIKWESTTSYQAAKMVPALPILQANHRYRLVVGLTTEPEQAVLLRLEFFNLQGERIKKLEFYNGNHQFVYPVGAFSYTLSLINAGAITLEFSRLQIADVQTPPAAFDDLWLQEPCPRAGDDQELFVLLVQDGKHSRTSCPDLGPAFERIPYQVVNIAWQYDGDLVEELSPLLTRQTKHLHLVSTTPATDQAVAKLCALHPAAKGLVTDQFNDPDLAHYQWTSNADWYSPEVSEPDWLTIGRAIQQQRKEG